MTDRGMRRPTVYRFQTDVVGVFALGEDDFRVRPTVASVDAAAQFFFPFDLQGFCDV